MRLPRCRGEAMPRPYDIHICQLALDNMHIDIHII